MGLIRISSILGLVCLAGGLGAQEGVSRHNLEAGMAGVFPLSGYQTYAYSSGPGWRPAYEIRMSRLLGAEMGLTQTWLPGSQCSSHGCEHPREMLELLDYGLRAHTLVAKGRVDLSAGIGGGYSWFEHDYSYANATLFQYSAKAAIAVDRRQRVRVGFTLRAWRDLGRPTQQWLSSTASVIFGFGGRP